MLQILLVQLYVLTFIIFIIIQIYHLTHFKLFYIVQVRYTYAVCPLLQHIDTQVLKYSLLKWNTNL